MKHGAALLVVVLVLALPGSAGAELVGYWSFDNQADPGHDDSGNGHDATLLGPTPPVWVSPGCLYFDGGEADVGEGVMTYGPDQDFMWMFKFNPDESGNDDAMLMSRRMFSGVGNQITMNISYFDDGHLKMNMGANGTGTIVYSDDPFEHLEVVGQWHEVTVIRDTTLGEFKMIVNGELQATIIDEGWDFSAPAGFGFGNENYQTSGPRYYHGYLDEVKVRDVPEPATLSLLALSGLLVAKRRR